MVPRPDTVQQQVVAVVRVHTRKEVVVPATTWLQLITLRETSLSPRPRGTISPRGHRSKTKTCGPERENPNMQIRISTRHARSARAARGSSAQPLISKWTTSGISICGPKQCFPKSFVLYIPKVMETRGRAGGARTRSTDPRRTHRPRRTWLHNNINIHPRLNNRLLTDPGLVQGA